MLRVRVPSRPPRRFYCYEKRLEAWTCSYNCSGAIPNLESVGLVPVVTLFIVALGEVIHCYGSWCISIDPNVFNKLLLGGGLELLIETALLKIYTFKGEGRNRRQDDDKIDFPK